MNKIAVIIDGNSGIDYLPPLAHTYVLRSTFQIEGKEYEDFVDMKAEALYDILVSNPNVDVSTSQVATGKIVELYNELIQKGYTDVICVTISSKLSNTINGMVLAESYVEGLKVHPVDSKTLTYSEYYLAVKAVEMIEAGNTVEEILAELNRIVPRTKIMVAVDTLKFLVKNGRLSTASGVLGTLFKIKPILELNSEGALEVFEKVRTTSKARERLVELFLKEIEGKKVRVFGAFTNNLDDLKPMLEEVERRASATFVEIRIVPLSPVVGVHAGPGTLGLGYIIEE